jgi:hypothetical protein
VARQTKDGLPMTSRTLSRSAWLVESFIASQAASKAP